MFRPEGATRPAQLGRRLPCRGQKPGEPSDVQLAALHIGQDWSNLEYDLGSSWSTQTVAYTLFGLVYSKVTVDAQGTYVD